MQSVYSLPSEPHGDGAGGDLGEPRGEHERGGGVGAGQAGGEREGYGEAVGDADDDVTDHLACGEVLLGVLLQEQPLLLLVMHERLAAVQSHLFSRLNTLSLSHSLSRKKKTARLLAKRSLD
jgi:hypothetical protein